MGSLDKRLERLEEQASAREETEESSMQQWLAVARSRRNQDLGRNEAWEPRDHVKFVRRRRERFNLTTTEEFLEKARTSPPHRDPTLLDWFLYRDIYFREEGTEGLEIPEEWRETFEAGAELLRLYEAIPDEVIARGNLAAGELPEDDEEARARWREQYEEPYGITAALLGTALGPNADEVSDDELLRRVQEHLAPVLYGEKGYRVSRIIDQLEKGKSQCNH